MNYAGVKEDFLDTLKQSVSMMLRKPKAAIPEADKSKAITIVTIALLFSMTARLIQVDASPVHLIINALGEYGILIAFGIAVAKLNMADEDQKMITLITLMCGISLVGDTAILIGSNLNSINATMGLVVTSALIIFQILGFARAFNVIAEVRFVFALFIAFALFVAIFSFFDLTHAFFNPVTTTKNIVVP